MTPRDVVARAIRSADAERPTRDWPTAPMADAVLAALREAGFAVVPTEPTPEMLGCIVYEDFDQDGDAGRELQMAQAKRGVPPERRVPYKAEYEWAVGQYARLLAAAEGCDQ